MTSQQDEPLSIWTIYARPKDFPNNYVARRFELDQPTSDIIVSPTLMGLRRQMLQRGLTRLNRFENDDPVIVETWM